MSEIKVAIAIIYFENKYLLGFRNKHQHQGNRYEFIGGKVEKNESLKAGLMREVKEEIGLDISVNAFINPMGVIRHEYSDLSNNKTEKSSKIVSLHVFRIELSSEYFTELLPIKQGSEGQNLKWVNLNDLICDKYKLPDANKTILEWLKLSETISITLDAKNFETIDIIKSDDSTKDKLDQYNNLNLSSKFRKNHYGENLNGSNEVKLSEILIKRWVDYYSNNLKQNTCVYVRLKSLNYKEISTAIELLINKRPDLSLIVNAATVSDLYKDVNCRKDNYIKTKKPSQIFAQHLTSSNLKKLFKENNSINPTELDKLINIPITVSCHNNDEIFKANQLLTYLINKNLKPIVGIFISPVCKTVTHPQKIPLGWQNFKYLASICEAPVIALGGLTPNDLQVARDNGADKIAGIRHF